MSSRLILSKGPLGFPWQTSDPFLFCVYHKDDFPAGPTVKDLRGRNIGSDFTIKDGFRMYHGSHGVPGFPQHPHRGFETITVVREGLVDHADSLGATARFGGGGSDTQWVTTGAGIQHSEMFPLVNEDKGNPMTLFQIWLNLDSKHKFCDPYFTMLWSESNPVIRENGAEITVIADSTGHLGAKTQSAPPDSWASQPGSDVAVAMIDLQPGAQWTLPAALKGTNRNVFFYVGDSVSVGGEKIAPNTGLKLDAEQSALIKNECNVTCQLLLLQGKPIGEPVVQRGPFVLNTQQELMQAFADYQRTQFGGWPWPRPDPDHGKSATRFAKYPDGREESPEVNLVKE